MKRILTVFHLRNWPGMREPFQSVIGDLNKLASFLSYVELRIRWRCVLNHQVAQTVSARNAGIAVLIGHESFSRPDHIIRGTKFQCLIDQLATGVGSLPQRIRLSGQNSGPRPSSTLDRRVADST